MHLRFLMLMLMLPFFGIVQCVNSTGTGDFYVVSAGQNTLNTAKRLQNGSTICPTDYGSGFSIMCSLPGAKMARFLIKQSRNESFKRGRIERAEPFTVAGDENGTIHAWKYYPRGYAQVACEFTVNGQPSKISIALDFRCTLNKPQPTPCATPTPTPTSHFSSNGTPTPIPTKGTQPSYTPMNSSLQRMPVSSKAAPTPTPSHASVQPTRTPTPVSLKATSTPSHTPTPTRRPIPTPTSTKAATPSPSPSPTKTPTPSRSPTPKVSKGVCVRKRGTDYEESKLPAGWTASGGAITYKDGDKNTDVEWTPKGAVTYAFKVPVRGHYGVVLDMETRHTTEHNDVYVSCDGGLTMRRFGRHFTRNRPVKVYHNKNGRAVNSFHKDFDPHTLSTTQVLVPGKTYKCHIMGRSTMTTIHALILFPCEGDSCDANSSHWRRSLDVCTK